MSYAHLPVNSISEYLEFEVAADMSSPSADRVELFQSIGLSESKAKETSKNQTVSDSLAFLVTKVIASSSTN